MINPLARSQERQNINLLRSNEKINSLQDNLVRDFFKRRQTNRSPIVARSLLKSSSSSSNSLKGFFFPVIKNDINDVHSYIQNYQDILIYYKDNIETILTNKKIKDTINFINENLKKNPSLIYDECSKVDINKLYEEYNCQKIDELITHMSKEINLYKNFTNELNQLFFILNLKFNNSNGKFSEQYIESNSLFSNIKFFIDEIKNKIDNSFPMKNNFFIGGSMNKSINLNLCKSISSSQNEEDDEYIIKKVNEMERLDEFLEEKFDDPKFSECFEKIKELYYKSYEEIFSCFIDFVKNELNENSFILKKIETAVINKTSNLQENSVLLIQIIEEKFKKLKEDNINLNKTIINLNDLLENQKNQNLKIKQQIETMNNIDFKEYLNELKEENINFIKKFKKVEQKKIELIKKQLQKKQEEYDELNTLNKTYREEINLLKQELEFKTFNNSETDFIKILKVQRDKMKEELLNQMKDTNRAYSQNLRECQEKIINLQEESKKSKELEQIFISRLNQLNNLFPRNL
jgi:hypothetical protein